MPDKKQSARCRLRLLIGIGVFLLIVETAAAGGWRVFRDGDRLTVMLNSFQHLIWRQIPKQVRDDDKGNQSLNTISGQESATRFDDEHYPIMVIIDNSPEARPSHSSLSAAVIVYETLVEGGATRLAAVFAGAPLPKADDGAERVGPIRSIRPVFVDIASGFGALLWHAGGSPEALALLLHAPVTDLNEISYLGPRYFWRDYAKPRPHNLFTDSERIKLALADFTAKISPPFQEPVPSLPREGEGVVWQWGAVSLAASSSPATTIAIDFSPGVLFDVEYNYDAVAGNYARVMAGRPHVDRQTSAQIAVDNIIVQRVPAEGYYPSGYGRLIINVIGQGQATFFRDGRAYGGRWRKTERAAQTEWLTADGAPFPLKPGTVWVEIVPGRRQASYQ